MEQPLHNVVGRDHGDDNTLPVNDHIHVTPEDQCFDWV